MPMTYRPMVPADEDTATDLWVDALEMDRDEARQTFRDFRNSPLRFGRSYVAVADDGTLLSTVCFWLREVRDAAGRPTRIGHLYHLATRAAARNQGHAGRLLRRVLAALQSEGCAWAILSAQADKHPGPDGNANRHSHPDPDPDANRHAHPGPDADSEAHTNANGRGRPSPEVNRGKRQDV